MTDKLRPPGKTTIAPDVLVSVARLTVLNVPGVSRLVPGTGANLIFKRGSHEGVEIGVENNTVYADIHVVIRRDTNVRDVSRAIQYQVARAISETVGMEVGKVNVHVEDIDYTAESEETA